MEKSDDYSIDALPNTDEIIDDVARIKLRLSDPDMIELRSENETECRLLMQREFDKFFGVYPALFTMVYDGGDLRPLAEMLCMIDEMKKGRVSKEKAEKELGENLADKYIPQWRQ